MACDSRLAAPVARRRCTVQVACLAALSAHSVQSALIGVEFSTSFFFWGFQFYKLNGAFFFLGGSFVFL